MRSLVVELQSLIMLRTNHSVVFVNDDTTNGNLSKRRSLRRVCKGSFQVESIVHVS